jgi:hypothetical protein
MTPYRPEEVQAVYALGFAFTPEVLRTAASVVIPQEKDLPLSAPTYELLLQRERRRIKAQFLALADAFAADRLRVVEQLPVEDDHDHPSLSAAERNPNLR